MSTSPPCPRHEGVWCNWGDRCEFQGQTCAFSEAEISRVQSLGGTLDLAYAVVEEPCAPCTVPTADTATWHRPVTNYDREPARMALMLDVCDAAEELRAARALPPSANGRIFDAVTALECCSKRLVEHNGKHPRG